MLNDLYLDAFNALSGDDFEEKPVQIEEFVTSEDYLNLDPLSDYQYQMVRAGSQIYRYDTLVALYGKEYAAKRFDQTCNECIYQLGKGSGKDYTSTIVVAYVVYLLLCLKDPARYYGKPSDDTIDILNIAVNSDQAKNVFFVNLKKRIKKCQWFNGKYEDTQYGMVFDKSIRVFSGHSERESFEGLNLFLAILDEISAFALESASGNKQANTAQATYDTYRDSVDSRFSEFGKVIMLSFPRFKDDFIQQRYNKVIAEKETIIRSATLLLDPDLPEDYPGNAFVVTWEEDHIIRYKYKKIFALRRPTWEVNPIEKIENYTRSFHENPGNALGKYACMPSNLEDGFFKNKQAIEDAYVTRNGVDADGIFLDTFKPRKDTSYYIHVDLAQKHDHCVVAMGHVDKWVDVKVGGDYTELHPVVQIDCVRWWTPTEDKSVDFADVREFIISLRRRGFKIKLATFDRWNSHDTMNILTNEHGIPTELLSIKKEHYDDYLSIMYDHRLLGPKIDLLIDELGELRTVQRGQKVTIDHPRKGTKDFSDATCGAIYNAVTYTPKPVSRTVDVMTYADLMAKQRAEAAEESNQFQGVIKAPPGTKPPKELQDYLARLKLM